MCNIRVLIPNATQMGARVYLPELGRFTQVDPIEGGTENNYVYPTDPVNEFDLTGEATLSGAHIGEGSHCLGKAFGGCFSYLLKKTSTALSASPMGFARSVGTRAAAMAWTSGTKGSGYANMMYHFGKHGVAVGARTPLGYTTKAITNRLLGSSWGKIVSGSKVYVKGNKIVQTYKGKLASFAKSKNPKKWFENQRR